MGHPEQNGHDERLIVSMDELISLGENFLRPEYPSTWTEANQYRREARLWLLTNLDDSAGLLTRFEAAFRRGFNPCAYSKDGITVDKPLDLDDADKMLAPVIAGVAETIQVLREASLKVKFQLTRGKSEIGLLKTPALPPINQGASKTEGPPKAFESWDKVELSFLSEERVQIFDGASNPTYNYSELGFEDRRDRKPNLAWKTLIALAEGRGIIQNGNSTGQHWRNVEKRMQEIRKFLRKHFGTTSDPFIYMEGVGYQARFKISCSPSFALGDISFSPINFL